MDGGRGEVFGVVVVLFVIGGVGLGVGVGFLAVVEVVFWWWVFIVFRIVGGFLWVCSVGFFFFFCVL